MSDTDEIQIVVDPENRIARVVIPAEAPPEFVTPEIVAGMARERGVLIDEGVSLAIETAVASFLRTKQATDEVLARAIDPKPGKPAWIEWIQSPEAAGEDAKEATAGDFYNAVQYVKVEEGDRVAVLHVEEPGVDGRDVCGGVIKPPALPQAKLDYDKASLELRDDGSLIARRCGVLRYSNGHAKVASVLEVEYVDFSTGNIDTKGSVHVAKGVRDNFEVVATEDVVVDGLVEAATIRCGRDLTLRRGMSARERGKLMVTGNAHVGFLNNVRVSVGGDLTVDHEIVNSEIVVRGALHAPRAALIGGVAVITGSIEVETLGSDSDTPTKLILSASPKILRRRKELMVQINQANAELEAAIAKRDQIQSMITSTPTPSQKEEMTELFYEVTMLEDNLEKLRVELLTVEQEIGAEQCVDLQVGKMIHPRVTLQAPGSEVVFSAPVRGPLRIGWNEARRLVAEQPSGAIIDLSDVIRLAA